MPMKTVQERGADQKIMKRLSGSTAPRTLETGNGEAAESSKDTEALAEQLRVANAQIDRLRARVEAEKEPAEAEAGKTTEIKLDRMAGVVDELSTENSRLAEQVKEAEAMLAERDRQVIKEVNRLKKQLAQAGTTDGDKSDPGRIVDVRRVVRGDDDLFLVYGIAESVTGKKTPTTIEMSVEAYRRFRRLKPESKGD
jgi:hypothetical protein